jgi:hypothetical protein
VTGIRGGRIQNLYCVPALLGLSIRILILLSFLSIYIHFLFLLLVPISWTIYFNFTNFFLISFDFNFSFFLSDFKLILIISFPLSCYGFTSVYCRPFLSFIITFIASGILTTISIAINVRTTYFVAV